MKVPDFSRIFQIACDLFKDIINLLCIRIILQLLPLIMSHLLKQQLGLIFHSPSDHDTQSSTAVWQMKLPAALLSRDPGILTLTSGHLF